MHYAFFAFSDKTYFSKLQWWSMIVQDNEDRNCPFSKLPTVKDTQVLKVDIVDVQ